MLRQAQYKKFGDPGTTYQVLYLVPAGSEQELPYESKKYGLNVLHKHFRWAGTSMVSILVLFYLFDSIMVVVHEQKAY